MKKLLAFTVACALSCAAIAFASSAQAQTAVPAPIAPTFQVNADFDNQTLVVAPGTVIEISLVENLSTGYAWDTRTQTGSTTASVTYKHINGIVAMPGASGTCVIKIAPVGTGTVTVEFAYSRANGPSAKTFTVTVITK